MFINDRIRDEGLGVLQTEGEELHLNSSEPTDYTEAKTTYSLGSKSSPTISAPGDGSPNGRSVTVSAIADGSVTGTGTATHFSIVDVTNNRLLVVGTLDSSAGVVSGNTFTLTPFEINFPDTA